MNNDLLFYGRNPFKEALNCQKIECVYLQNGFSDKNILNLIAQNNLKITYLSINELNNLCMDKHHQGIAFKLKYFKYYELEDIIVKHNDRIPLILILDEINDPHNLGAIIRSADVFGVDGVIIKKRNQVMVNSTVMKSSAGAANFVKIVLVNNLNQTISKLKENGYWIVSSDGSASLSYTDLKYDFPTALVVGSEGFGISSLLLKNSDYVVKIPLLGKVNSLNASTATAVLLARIRS